MCTGSKEIRLILLMYSTCLCLSYLYLLLYCKSGLVTSRGRLVNARLAFIVRTPNVSTYILKETSEWILIWIRIRNAVSVTWSVWLKPYFPVPGFHSWILIYFKECKMNQCWESMTFWCGSGSANPYLWLTNPDTTPDPDPFFSDFKDAKKNQIFFPYT